MASLKYFYDLMSQPSRTVYIFLKLTGIPFEACPVPLLTGVHLTEEFKRDSNRFQKVPFIHHGNFKLSESIAIIRYLCREFPEKIADHWYPKDSLEQAKVDEYLEWQHLNTRLAAAMYFQKKWLIPNMTGTPADPKNVATYEKNLVKVLDLLEELWLSQGHEYIVGNRISVADIFAASELEETRIAGFDCTQGRPKLQEWMEKVKRECAPAYQEAHKTLEKVVKAQLTKSAPTSKL